MESVTLTVRDLPAWPPLPPGVHRLSEESQAILARAAEKSAAVAARHTKRGS